MRDMTSGKVSTVLLGVSLSAIKSNSLNANHLDTYTVPVAVNKEQIISVLA
jgi:hypothetical protein